MHGSTLLIAHLSVHPAAPSIQLSADSFVYLSYWEGCVWAGEDEQAPVLTAPVCLSGCWCSGSCSAAPLGVASLSQRKHPMCPLNVASNEPSKLHKPSNTPSNVACLSQRNHLINQKSIRPAACPSAHPLVCLPIHPSARPFVRPSPSCVDCLCAPRGCTRVSMPMPDASGFFRCLSSQGGMGFSTSR
jgi:hypothetical protein